MSEPDDIRQRTLSGIGWTGGSRIAQQLVQFVFTAILARILVPNDFGLIAMIGVFIGFAGIFIDFGLGSALVQREVVDQRHRNSAFWLNAGLGLLLMLVMMALAPVLAAFYNEPQLLPITLAIAPMFLVGSLSGVQSAMLEREMNFRSVSLIENASFLGSNIVAVGMAVAGLGVWSLVGLMIAQSVIRCALLWALSSWRPRATLDRDALRELWSFSSSFTWFNTINYWARNADNLLIGRFVGVNQLAFYSRAYSLMLLPIDTVSVPISRVMFPALSRLQGDTERLRRTYVRALGMIALTSFPVVVGLFAVARPFVLTVYGSKWAAVIPLLQILSLASLVQCLSRTSGWIYMSTGRTDWMVRWGVFSTVTALCSFVIGLPWGVRGVAISYTCWNVLILYPCLSIPGRLIGLSMLDVARSVSGAGAASLLMGVVVWVAERNMPTSWLPVTRLTLGVLAGVVTYVVALHLISPGSYRDLRNLIREYQARRSRPRTA